MINLQLPFLNHFPLSKKATKRLRIFAGPNGSGKSTLAKALKNPKDKRIKLGVFVNADEIEQALNKDGFVSLYKYFRFTVTTKELRTYILSRGMSPKLLKGKEIEQQFSIRKNKIYLKNKTYNSYLAADIAGFVRNQLLLKGNSFSFETVFSHPSKLAIIEEAKALGFKIYFYFLTTDAPEINVNRVKVRVAKSGHPVPEKKIIDRYYRSLDLLFDAIKMSDRAFLFDNSGKHYELVAQITNGKHVEITDYDKIIPNWFIKYIFNKIPQ